MNKVKIPNTSLIYPLPAILAGVMVNNKPNYTMLGNCGIISVKPSVIYISSQKSHCLNKGINKNNVFSINIPSANMVIESDYCGITSGNKANKSTVFETFTGENNLIPMIKQSPINLACKVIENVNIYEMEVYISEVLETYANETCFTDGELDTKKINPLIYCMDNNYWKLDSVVGKGFSEGKKYRKHESNKYG